MACQYATYTDYYVKLDLETSELLIRKGERILAEKLVFVKNGQKLCFCEAFTERAQKANVLTVKYQAGAEMRELTISVGNRGVVINSRETLGLKGKTTFGEGIRAMSTDQHDFFRSGYGIACTPLDDMLFDTQTDCGFVISGETGRRFRFNHETNVFEIDVLIQKEICIKFEENMYADRYDITYSPVNKNTTFKKPPVGWMTWYALQFDVTEERVLNNAKWLSENLNRYGVDTMWIDWEWCHDQGVAHNLKPDPNRYPNGMKYLADEIKKYGLVPSLWIGFSTERMETDYMKEHPEIVLAIDPYWCGDYFFDFSHPTYMNEYLPMALKQLDDWGFVGVKFDTLGPGIRAHERHRGKMYNPDLSSRRLFRDLIKKTREVLGKDRFMLSCCAVGDAEVLWTCDMFEAARIGADVFTWEEFVNNTVGRVMRYYPFHNVVFYNDPDCVIAREEHSTMEQLKSRAAFVSMLGLPVTLGDDMPALPEERVEIMRRSIPVLDIHTMDFCHTGKKDVVITNLTVDTDVQRYNLVSVFNTTDKDITETVYLDYLGIDTKEPIAYEYYSGVMQEVDSGIITSVLKPFETKIYAIREKTACPQIVSTNRHVTQGIIELKKDEWNESKRTLSLTAELVGQDLYTVSVRIPESYQFKEQKGFDDAEIESGILKLYVTVDENETRDFEIVFA